MPSNEYLSVAKNSVGHNIYQQQSLRERIPLEHLAESDVNRQRRPQPDFYIDQSPDHFDSRSYTNQAGIHRPYASPLKQNQIYHRRAYHQQQRPIYHSEQQPLTPSPTRQPVQNLADSVASPFFKSNTARSHTGRLTFKDRLPPANVQDGLLASHQQSQRRAYGQRPQQPGSNAIFPGTPRISGNGPLYMNPGNSAIVPASPYFDGREQGPIAPRANLFAGRVSAQPVRRSTAADFRMVSRQGTGIGPSGPSRMSLEGQRRRPDLGDYLAAQEGDGLESSSHNRQGAGGRVRRLARR